MIEKLEDRRLFNGYNETVVYSSYTPQTNVDFDVVTTVPYSEVIVSGSVSLVNAQQVDTDTVQIELNGQTTNKSGSGSAPYMFVLDAPNTGDDIHFELDLLNPEGGDSYTLNNVTIKVRTPTVTFNITGSHWESTDVVMVQATRSGDSGKYPITVDIATMGGAGKATDDLDYNMPDSITFGANTKYMNFSVAIVDDDLDEETEAVLFAPVANTRCLVGGNYTFNILDDD